MPKELTHWWLAAESLRLLPEESPTRKLLTEYSSEWLVGATLPDTLMHLLRGPYNATALRLANSFHDTTQSSYTPLLNFLKTASGPSGCSAHAPAIQACLLGLASHMEADIVFHPFVYSQSGSDIGRHYRIETELDLWLLNRNCLPPAFYLHDLLRGEVADTASMVMAGIFDPAGELPGAAHYQALAAHSRIQAMYSSPFWQLLAKLLGYLPGTAFHNWQWLFYPYNWRNGAVIHWPEQWQDPATGLVRHESPTALLESAIRRIRGLLLHVDGEGIEAALHGQTGENLLNGLPPEKFACL